MTAMSTLPVPRDRTFPSAEGATPMMQQFLELRAQAPAEGRGEREAEHVCDEIGGACCARGDERERAPHVLRARRTLVSVGCGTARLHRAQAHHRWY